MNATIEQRPLLNHDAIANLASRIWEQNGRQAGRDQEYWLQAEWQLRGVSQREIGEANQAAPKRKGATATGRKARVAV